MLARARKSLCPDGLYQSCRCLNNLDTTNVDHKTHIDMFGGCCFRDQKTVPEPFSAYNVTLISRLGRPRCNLDYHLTSPQAPYKPPKARSDTFACQSTSQKSLESSNRATTRISTSHNLASNTFRHKTRRGRNVTNRRSLNARVLAENSARVPTRRSSPLSHLLHSTSGHKTANQCHRNACKVSEKKNYALCEHLH